MEVAFSIFETMATMADAVIAIFMFNQIFEKIEEVLKTSDDTYLQIFTLTYRDKMSNKEIAYILDAKLIELQGE